MILLFYLFKYLNSFLLQKLSILNYFILFLCKFIYFQYSFLIKFSLILNFIILKCLKIININFVHMMGINFKKMIIIAKNVIFKEEKNLLGEKFYMINKNTLIIIQTKPF